MKGIWSKTRPPLNPEDIVKLALGPKKAKDLDFNDWEAILAEIIVGDYFGVDRTDYLLRDSYHAGVAYGKFDHHRLIDTLRILTPPIYGDAHDSSLEPSLGVEMGGLQSTEALLLARYFMYTQVYFHPVRRIYDIHLKYYMMDWLGNKNFPTKIDGFLFLRLTDNEITSNLRQACWDPQEPGHIHADRIIKRKHFKVLYSRVPGDFNINPDAAKLVKKAAAKKFGKENIRLDEYSQKGGMADFPVLLRDGTVESSLQVSQVLKDIPSFAVNYVFINSKIRNEAESWLTKHKNEIITPEEEGEL